MSQGSLDEIDRRILRLLQEDARCSNKELAARVGLAPSSCLERVRRLVRNGVLRGFHAEVEPGALGLRLRLLVCFRCLNGIAVEQAAARLQDWPEVVRVWQVAGPDPLLALAVFRDQHHLGDFLADHRLAAAGLLPVDPRLVLQAWSRPLPDLDATGRGAGPAADRELSRGV